MDKAKYQEQIFEIKKDKIYKQNMESRYLVVHATLSNREKVDIDL